MTYTVYHIRNGTVSIISFQHKIEERHSMSQGGLMSAGEIFTAVMQRWSM